jgi:SNF2 family DNA or RNA helicase
VKVIDNKALVLKTKRPHLVTEQVDDYKILNEVDGVYKIAVPWRLHEAQVLAGLKVKEVPSPMTRDYSYTGRYEPFDHQKETASFLTLHKKAFCFNEQGTGKTASVIWAVDYLMQQDKVKRVLVICPLSIMKSAWQEDLFKFAMHRSCSVAHGTSEQRKKILNAGAEFVIINFDGVAVVKDEIINGGFDVIVVDEANAYKNTGTPAAQSPVDAFGLAKLVNAKNAPKYYGQFRDKVMHKVSQFTWRPKPEANKIVHEVLQPAIRFEKDQCLDLPSVTYVDREAPLTKQQASYYKRLKDRMTMEADGEQVTSVNAAVNLNKLLQISGGAVYSDEKEVIEFDVSNRLNVVKEVIDESSHKVLVFVPFTHTIELLNDFLTKSNIPCKVISGKVSVNKRSEIIKDFQETDKIQVLIIQPQAASHGLTLTAANTIIWYAPVTSVETYLQANARIDRPGQHNPMTVVHIRGSEVETRLYTMLRSKVNHHNKIIDLYKQELNT